MQVRLHDICLCTCVSQGGLILVTHNKYIGWSLCGDQVYHSVYGCLVHSAVLTDGVSTQNVASWSSVSHMSLMSQQFQFCNATIVVGSAKYVCTHNYKGLLGECRNLWG